MTTHPPIARHNDPETSQLAAVQAEKNLTLQQTQMRIALATPMTANEAAKWCSEKLPQPIVLETYRKRAGELARKGKARIVGRRRCLVTGTFASVYEAV